MRKLQIEASLVILWLLAGGIGYASGQGRPPRVRVAASQAKKEKVFVCDMKGRGESREDAEQDALGRAREVLHKFFHDQGNDLSWEPPLKYISDHLVKDNTALDPDDIQGIGPVCVVRLHVEMTASDYLDVLRQDRRFVSYQRMLLLAKVLAGVVALLAAVAGYFRLEEATKGYYTTWLRVGTLGFLAAVGAVLLLLA